MKISTPGKLILSGEHAVVYGKPAIAIATNKHITSTIKKTKEPNFTFNFLAKEKTFSLKEIFTITDDLTCNYQRFLKSEIDVKDITSSQPSNLVCFCTGLVLAKVKPKHGFHIDIESNIPLSCGMGASAAIIVNLLTALVKFYEIKITDKELLAMAIQAENMQHGYSSGIDVYTSYYGGFVRYQNQQLTKINVPNLTFQLINTGKPNCSTGECVVTVAKNFKDSNVWQDFERSTEDVYSALRSGNQEKLKLAIKANNKLLIKIGVVPEKVQNFIAELEAEGAAAKICGAGAINGDNAGMIIAISEKDLRTICDKYNYSHNVMNTMEYNIDSETI